MTLTVVVEGDTDLPIARKLARDAGFEVALEIDQGGKDALDASLAGYANAAKGSPWLVLRDLDDDAECAPAFLRRRSVASAPWLSFRLAVRAAEAWLMADAQGIGLFLGVSPRVVPPEPDLLGAPKRALVDLARKGRPAIRRGLVPPPGSSRQVGPLYESLLIEFATLHWDLGQAARRSPSLRRSRDALRELAARWREVVSGAAGPGPVGGLRARRR